MKPRLRLIGMHERPLSVPALERRRAARDMLWTFALVGAVAAAGLMLLLSGAS